MTRWLLQWGSLEAAMKKAARVVGGFRECCVIANSRRSSPCFRQWRRIAVRPIHRVADGWAHVALITQVAAAMHYPDAQVQATRPPGFSSTLSCRPPFFLSSRATRGISKLSPTIVAEKRMTLTSRQPRAASCSSPQSGLHQFLGLPLQAKDRTP